MSIADIKKGDRLAVHGVAAQFEVLRVNRVTVRVRKLTNGHVFSVYAALFDRKIEEAE